MPSASISSGYRATEGPEDSWTNISSCSVRMHMAVMPKRRPLAAKADLSASEFCQRDVRMVAMRKALEAA